MNYAFHRHVVATGRVWITRKAAQLAAIKAAVKPQDFVQNRLVALAHVAAMSSDVTQPIGAAIDESRGQPVHVLSVGSGVPAYLKPVQKPPRRVVAPAGEALHQRAPPSQSSRMVGNRSLSMQPCRNNE
jgi:hypothetical protein